MTKPAAPGDTVRLESATRARSLPDVSVAGRQSTILSGQARSTSRSLTGWRLGQSIGTTFVPLIAVRRRPGPRWADAVQIVADDYNGVADAEVILQLYVCPADAVGDGTWAAVRTTPPDESAAEVNRTATTFDLTEAMSLDALLINAPGSGSNAAGATQASTKRMPLVRDLELVLAGRAFSGTATLASALSWLETRRPSRPGHPDASGRDVGRG